MTPRLEKGLQKLTFFFPLSKMWLRMREKIWHQKRFTTLETSFSIFYKMSISFCTGCHNLLCFSEGYKGVLTWNDITFVQRMWPFLSTLVPQGTCFTKKSKTLLIRFILTNFRHNNFCVLFLATIHIFTLAFDIEIIWNAGPFRATSFQDGRFDRPEILGSLRLMTSAAKTSLFGHSASIGRHTCEEFRGFSTERNKPRK